MIRTSRPAVLLAFVASALLLAAIVVPAAALAAREREVVRALDYAHAHQQANGGFIDAGASDSPSTTPWAILAIAASREDARAWNVSGRDPIDYLQSLNLESAARSTANAPAYYAKTVLAYRAAVKDDTIIMNAGNPKIDLLGKMETYWHDVKDDPATEGVNEDTGGYFSPYTSGDLLKYSVSTTAWALLAYEAAGTPDSNTIVSEAERWLLGVQNTDGGWSIDPAGGQYATSTVDQTAAVIQALVVSGTSASNTAVERGLGFLRAAQLVRSDGGFPSAMADPRSNAESTAWAVQAIYAVDQRPTDARWLHNGKSPVDYLLTLDLPDGSFLHSHSTKPSEATGGSKMMTTTQVTIALGGKAFPFYLPASPLKSSYLPTITSFKPGNGAVFSSTNDVRVTAEYKDNSYGTGIKTSAVRVKVDGVNKTKQAKVHSSNLSLVLVDLSYGQHTVEVLVADKAGNTRTSTHTITVSYSSGAGGTPAPIPTYRPPTPSTTLYPTPKPTTTLYPTPAATPVPTTAPTTDGTVTGVPLGPSGSPSPSPSASGAAAAGDDGGGSGGPLGVTLLAMLPIGAGLSYWLHRRQAEALAPAGRGRLLTGGGTPWQRLKGRVPGLS